MSKPIYKTFGEIRQGEHFQETPRGGRKFIKMMTVLPSGLKQTIVRRIEGEVGINERDYFNAIDYKGCLAKCPDFVTFRVIKSK